MQGLNGEYKFYVHARVIMQTKDKSVDLCRAVVAHALGGRGRWISEFEASLVYKVSSRTASAIQRNAVSKKPIILLIIIIIIIIIMYKRKRKRKRERTKQPKVGGSLKKMIPKINL
jgi:hypothetical protein